MEWYIIGAFLAGCAYIFIRWQIDYYKWKGANLRSGKKHDKETAATSATDVTGSLPAAGTLANSDQALHGTYASYGSDNQYDLTDSDPGSFDSYGSDSGYDSGGYDSGGSYS